MKLHHQVIGSGKPLVILHGLFSSSVNWRSMAKQLAQYAQVITLDLRNHGNSPHSLQQNYPLMAGDLMELLDDLNLDKVNIIGHSVGGKVAMAFTESYPERVDKLVVVDISPRQYIDDDRVIFNEIMAVDLSLYTRRSEVDEALSSVLSDKAVRQFLIMNISSANGQLSWRINLQALHDNYSHFLAAVVEQDNVDVASCFIRGGTSSYIQDKDELLIYQHFTQVEIYTIEQAGHWVHIDAPQQFLTKIKEFFDYD